MYNKYIYYSNKHNRNKKVNETALHLNPNMNITGVGSVELPGDPGSMNSFSSQNVGSGDAPVEISTEVNVLSYDEFLKVLKGK